MIYIRIPMQTMQFPVILTVLMAIQKTDRTVINELPSLESQRKTKMIQNNVRYHMTPETETPLMQYVMSPKTDSHMSAAIAFAPVPLPCLLSWCPKAAF